MTVPSQCHCGDMKVKGHRCVLTKEEMAARNPNEALRITLAIAEERIEGYRLEVERLKIDLSKSPEERYYCRGCTLPREEKCLRETLEWAIANVDKYVSVHGEVDPEWEVEVRRRAKVLCECGADKVQCIDNRTNHKVHLNQIGGE